MPSNGEDPDWAEDPHWADDDSSERSNGGDSEASDIRESSDTPPEGCETLGDTTDGYTGDEEGDATSKPHQLDEDEPIARHHSAIRSDQEDDHGGQSIKSGSDSESPGLLRWFLDSEQTSVLFLREFLISAAVVMLLALLLFAISGVWPPMVAVESGSMEPHMQRGDLVFVMDEHRLVPDAAVYGTGIATVRSSIETGYRRFGDYGDVIVYNKNGASGETPIIHRVRFWVNESENWVGKANSSYLNGRTCGEIANCPADHAGFITKGDDNDRYDQISGISDVVSPKWIKGTAEVRIPWLGHIRLALSKLSTGQRITLQGTLLAQNVP